MIKWLHDSNGQSQFKTAFLFQGPWKRLLSIEKDSEQYTRLEPRVIDKPPSCGAWLSLWYLPLRILRISGVSDYKTGDGAQ